jgi:hypothetical protein
VFTIAALVKRYYFSDCRGCCYVRQQLGDDHIIYTWLIMYVV